MAMKYFTIFQTKMTQLQATVDRCKQFKNYEENDIICTYTYKHASMKYISRNDFPLLLKEHHIKPRLQREVRFVPDLVAWDELELLAITTRSANEGVLLVELNGLLMIPFEIKRKLIDTRTGRSKPITCDFCYTWQKGGNAAAITFSRPDKTSVTFLCCADLACSMHVRGKTPESALSRSQLHEDMTVEQRIMRLRQKLQAITDIVL